MAYLFLVASRSGRAAGLVTVAGVTLGLAVYLAVTLAGLAEALRWPWILETLRWAGVAYLAWLAVEAWRTAGAPLAVATSEKRLFVRGLVNNVLNPKAAILYLVLLPGFIRPELGDPRAQALQLGLIHLGFSAAVHASIVMAGAGAGRALTAWPGARRRVERLFAVGLLAVAAWVAVTPA
ncbi:MAG: LysE family translocator [Phenylobacterium sp.]|nr:LysE family translocator [Phenylobacterium sp.]